MNELVEIRGDNTPKALPPIELWNYNPFEDGPMQTPLDERGVVDSHQLIKLVESTVDPSYDWKSRLNNKHHLQWPNASYRRFLEDGNLDLMPRKFRSLTSGMIILPEIFHNWLHLVTEPPPVPSDEVMQYRIKAHDVAVVLFQQVRDSKRMARRQELGRRGLEELLLRRYDSFEALFEEGKSLPDKFQPIDFSNHELNSFQDMLDIGQKLGRHAMLHSAVQRLARNTDAA